MERRQLLKRIGAIGTVGFLAGCQEPSTNGTETAPQVSPEANTQTPTETPAPESNIPDPYRERFSRTVNLAEEGAQPDESTSLNSVLDEVASDDTLLFLPEGRYLMSEHWVFDEFDNFGIYGNDATIVPPDGYTGDLFILGDGASSRGLVVDGLSFDVTASDTGPRVLQATLADDLLVRDVSVSGVQDTDQGLTRFDITDPDGEGRVEGMELPDGGEPGTVATGCLVGPLSEGEITFSECRMEKFPDNGLYASPAPGIVNVYGGYYANNGISNVRVSDGSEVRGVHVVCDEARDGIQNMRGIRLRRGSGATIRDSTIELREVTASDGAITLSTEMGAATIENTTIRVDADEVPAIRAKTPSNDGESESGENRLTCENLVVTGDAAAGSTIHVAERDEASFRELCIEQTGPDRDGLFFLRSNDSVVADSQVNVTGEAVVSRDSAVRNRNLDTDPTLQCGSE